MTIEAFGLYCDREHVPHLIMLRAPLLSCHMRTPVMTKRSGRNPDRNTSTPKISSTTTMGTSHPALGSRGRKNRAGQPELALEPRRVEHLARHDAAARAGSDALEHAVVVGITRGQRGGGKVVAQRHRRQIDVAGVGHGDLVEGDAVALGLGHVLDARQVDIALERVHQRWLQAFRSHQIQRFDPEVFEVAARGVDQRQRSHGGGAFAGFYP